MFCEHLDLRELAQARYQGAENDLSSFCRCVRARQRCGCLLSQVPQLATRGKNGREGGWSGGL